VSQSSVASLAPARAAAASRLLEQYLIACPGCEQPAAVHVDNGGDDQPVLVRIVCPNACRVGEEDVLARLLVGRWSRRASA
jgi:hypothetical protein